MNRRNFLNSRIVASLTLEEVVGHAQLRPLRSGITFDVTEPILNLRLRHIRSLVDDTDSTNDLVAYFDGWAALGHQGPNKVEVTDSIRKFFGVEKLTDIDREKLMLAREAQTAGKAIEVAKAVFAACQRNVEKSRSLESVNIDSIVERVMRERTSVSTLVEQVNANLAVLRSVLEEPREIRYGPSLTMEIAPAGLEERLELSCDGRGQTVIAYSDDGLTVAVYNEDGSDSEPLSSLRFNAADLEGKWFEALSTPL